MAGSHVPPGRVVHERVANISQNDVSAGFEVDLTHYNGLKTNQSGTCVGDTSSLTNFVRLLQTAVTISPQEFLSYAELRSAIEVQAAENASEKDVAELAALLTQLDDEELLYANALEIDFRFHRKLLSIAGNKLMQILMEVIYEFVLAQMARKTPSQKENQLGRRLHNAILKAIRDHDPDAAESAMRKHMQAVVEQLEKLS